MKSLCLTLLSAVLSLSLSSKSMAQTTEADSKKTLPSVNLKRMDGTSFNTADIQNDGKPMVLNFWATWCKPCVNELNTISELYADWQKETGMKIVAISIDDPRTVNTVAPFVNGKGWEYEVLLDPNSEFRRAMNVNNIPHVFVIDGKGNIVAQHNSYSPGDEEKLYEEIRTLISK